MTEHLLVWDGDDALPEWTVDVDVEEEDDIGVRTSCNTRKDRYTQFSL